MRGLEVNERVQLGTRALRLLRERMAQVEILRRVVERVEVVVRVSVVPSDGASELAVHDLRKGVVVAVVALVAAVDLVAAAAAAVVAAAAVTAPGRRIVVSAM